MEKSVVLGKRRRRFRSFVKENFQVIQFENKKSFTPLSESFQEQKEVFFMKKKERGKKYRRSIINGV